MYPPYVSLRVLRRFPAFFFPRLPPFFGLPFFVGLAFLGLPAIMKLRSVSQVQRNLQQNDVRDEKLTPIYSLASDRKSDRNDIFLSNVSIYCVNRTFWKFRSDSISIRV